MIRNRDAALKGAGLAIFVVLSMTYALSIFGTTGFGDIGWSALALGVLFFGALAAPAALRLLREGLAGLPEAGAGAHPSVAPGRAAPVSAATPQEEKGAERQLLEAIERHGKITPARAALETTLTVVEADRMLGELAGAGHLSVGTEDGALVYSLPGGGERGIEGR
jgi:hypothetical protein